MKKFNLLKKLPDFLFNKKIVKSVLIAGFSFSIMPFYGYSLFESNEEIRPYTPEEHTDINKTEKEDNPLHYYDQWMHSTETTDDVCDNPDLVRATCLLDHWGNCISKSATLAEIKYCLDEVGKELFQLTPFVNNLDRLKASHEIMRREPDLCVKVPLYEPFRDCLAKIPQKIKEFLENETGCPFSCYGSSVMYKEHHFTPGKCLNQFIKKPLA